MWSLGTSLTRNTGNMMVIDNKYEIGQIVFLKTDKEQLERLIIGINISSLGIIYRVVNGAIETYHYEMELLEEKNILA